MTEALSELSTYIREARPTLVEDAFIAYGELTLLTTGANVVDLLTFLRDDPRCAFDVVYHLMSPKQNQRIRVKLATAEEEPVPSVTSVYPGADWAEREAWDMYGILFTGHPDLRRILTDYGFEGHPLRKDFPTTGFVEVRYDDSLKRVVYEPVELRQEFRSFDFLSPWEGPEYVLPGDEKANT